MDKCSEVKRIPFLCAMLLLLEWGLLRGLGHVWALMVNAEKSRGGWGSGKPLSALPEHS